MKIQTLKEFAGDLSQLTRVTHTSVLYEVVPAVMQVLVSGTHGKQFSLDSYDYYIEYLNYGQIPENIKLLLEICLGYSLPHYSKQIENEFLH